MRRLLPFLCLLATVPAVSAQEAPVQAIRAWFGPTLMFATDLSDNIGAGYDLRVTIERPDVIGVSVVLGGSVSVDADNNATDALTGAFLVGRSFPVAQDAFLHLAAGLGYTRVNETSARVACSPSYPYDCTSNGQTTISGVVPVRAELHVPYRRDRSFGIVAQTMLFGTSRQRFGLGLHYSFGRNF